MHSFHHSRGKILFGVFCAFAMSASLAGAWVETGAAALLAGAGVAALYGAVHAFDVRRPGRNSAEIPTPEVAGEAAADVPASEQLLTGNDGVEEPDLVEPATPQPAETRARAPRKTRAGSGRAPKKPKAPKPALVAEVENKAAVAEIVPFDEPEAMIAEEMTPVPVAPLFEPEPFVRQQRTVFGRKAG